MKPETKTILITAGNSLVGKDLINFLLINNYKVISIVRKLKDLKNRKNLKIIKHDFKTKLKLTNRIDLIINTIATHEFSKNKTFYDHYLSNIKCVQNIADLSIQKKNAPIINLSTISVYKKNNHIINENNSISKSTYLASSKYVGEKILEISGVRYINLRLPGILTFNSGSINRPWLRKMIHSIISNEPIHIFNKNSKFNSIIDTIELFKFIEFYLKRKKKTTGTFNLASSNPLKLGSIINEIIKFYNSSSVTKWSRKIENSSSTISIKKIQNELGYKPSTLKHILKRYLKKIVI